MDIVKTVGNTLDGVRRPGTKKGTAERLRAGGLFLLLGGALGVLSKWLDTLAVDDGVWWQRVIGALDLGNVLSLFPIWLLIALAVAVYADAPLDAALRVFLFFAGMCGAYHLSSVLMAGFNPMGYMMIWYGFTAVSPLLAAVCWYSKGKTVPSLVIDTLILWIMMSCCFAVGFWYFDFRSVTDTLIFIASAAVLYVSPKRTAVSLAGALAMTLLFPLPVG